MHAAQYSSNAGPRACTTLEPPARHRTVSIAAAHMTPALFLSSNAGMNPLSVWQRGGHPPNECPPGCSSYSIKQEFDGAVVFITGASGYIGSVVLEQLLRTTNVAKVYLLLRPRRGQSIQARADALLQGALFHKVRGSKPAGFPLTAVMNSKQ